MSKKESKTIPQIFNESCDRVKVDRHFLKQIRDIRIGFLNRNEDHLNFFSGNLLGVYPIRYLTSDRLRWYDEILEVDESDIKEGIRLVDYLDPEWVRANDGVNLSCIWLLYKIVQAKGLSAKDQEQGATDVVLYMQYKFLSSIMAHYFPYPADQATAVATYEALSRKFEIKQHGSWQALLEHRTKLILQSSSIHYVTYTQLNDDAAIVYMISDIQQRLREVVKKYRAIFQKVKDENLRITSTTTVIELDGERELVERGRDYTDYTRYLKDVIGDKPTFIRKELVDVIRDAMYTMSEDHLYQALSYSSDNAGVRGDPNIFKLIEETLLHAYQYLSDNKGVMSSPSDLASLIEKLKYLYSASRMSNPQLIKMRDLADKIIKRSVKSRNAAALASVRTGLQLYLVLRAFARKHYQGG
jgi:hypothetical protein